MKVILFIALTILSITVMAQENQKTPKITVSPFTAQFMISTDFHAVCFNLVGTGIKYTNKDVSISVSIFPSLVFKEDKPTNPTDPKRPFVRPGFALGPLILYKRIMVGFPAFYQDDAWHMAVGVGVKIGK